MATATVKKGRSKVVQKSAVDQISSLLQQLPKKEKQELPLAEAIAELSETIQASLAKGYRYDELSQMLSEKLGVSVSVWSLRRYLNAAKQGDTAGKTGTKLKRGRKAKAKTALAAIPATATEPIEAPTATVAVTAEANAATPEPSADAPAPAKKRGTRSAATRTTDTPDAAPAKKRGTRTKTAAAAKPDGGAKTTARKARTTAPSAKAAAPRGRKKKAE